MSPRASRASSSVPAKPDDAVTGILIKSDHIHKFLDKTHPKTCEVRSRNCLQFKSGDQIYLLECGLSGIKGPGGRANFRVLASARWAGCEPISRTALPSRINEHRVTTAELNKMYAEESTKQVFLWHFVDVQPMSSSEIFYIESCKQDRVPYPSCSLLAGHICSPVCSIPNVMHTRHPHTRLCIR
jgi:hypothetical protein